MTLAVLLHSSPWGICPGNIGQEYTDSSNELGRVLKDRMHVILDLDYFFPQPIDMIRMSMNSTNPRVLFSDSLESRVDAIWEEHRKLLETPPSY